MSSDNLSLTSSMQHQQALGSQTSAGSPPTALTDPTISSQKRYILSYDACHWYHLDTTNKITRLDGLQIYIGTSVDGSTTNKQRYGVLGIYLSWGSAQTVGREWLYDQLKAVQPDIHRPLPIQDNSRCDKVTWKASPWTRYVDSSLVHSVGDTFRRVELAISVKECAVDDMDPGVERGEMENAAGGETEIVDLTDDDGSSPKGSDGEFRGRMWRPRMGMERW